MKSWHDIILNKVSILVDLSNKDTSNYFFPEIKIHAFIWSYADNADRGYGIFKSNVFKV